MRRAAWTSLSELIQPVSQMIRNGARIPVRLMFGCLAGAKRLEERPGTDGTSQGCEAQLTGWGKPSVFPVPLHQFVGVGQENRRAQEREVDENLPLDVFGILVGHVDKGF